MISRDYAVHYFHLIGTEAIDGIKVACLKAYHTYLFTKKLLSVESY